MSFRLAIADGRTSRTLEVQDEVTAGTAARCGLRLGAPGVGRRHARLRQFGRRVVVEDLGAASGVQADGRRVRRIALAAGQMVQLGEARVRVIDVLPDPAAAVARRAGRGGRAPLRPLPVVLSATLHGVLLAALWAWSLSPGAAPSEPVSLSIATAAAPHIPEQDEEVPLVDPVETLRRPEPEVELLPPEEPLPDVPLAAADTNLRAPPKVERTSEPAPREEAPPERSATVGLGGGEIPPELSSRSFGKGEAAGANRAAAGLVEGDVGGGAALRTVRGRAARTNVWVIRGDYDQAEKVLTELGVDHAVLGKDDPETREVPASVRVLFYNCTGHALSPEAQKRIAWWTYEGGWLVSTDWGVERLLASGLPGTVAPLRVNDRPVLTKDETVGVRPTTDKGLARGLPPADAHARWWLEDSSVPFTIAQGIGAEVLVRSDELERRIGHGAGAVAVTFPYGKGRVLHLLGHVYQQEGNLRGAVIVQRLVVNYLAAALAGDGGGR